jgi:ElaB/YqjD/DUF883 family membrane-anchored ribosome-binding protein
MNNLNRNVSFGTGTGPSGISGSEVESAMFTPELGHDETFSTSVHPGGRASVMRKLEDLKFRGISRVHDVQRVVGDCTSLVKSNVQRSMTTAKTSARDGVNTGVMRVQSSMRNSPAKWAGIAAGSGFILGMLGRIIHSRKEQHRHMPQLVVIETSC